MRQSMILSVCVLLLTAGCDKGKPKQNKAQSSVNSTVETPAVLPTTDPKSLESTLVPNAAIKPLTKVTPKDPKMLVAAAVSHKGGLKNLEKIKSVISESTHSGVLERVVKVSIVYPDKIRVDYYNKEILEKGIILNGTKGYQITQGSVVDLSESVIRDIKKATLGEVLPLLVAASKKDAELTYLGETEVEGQKADAVKIKTPHVGEIIFFVAIESGAFIGEQIQLEMGLQTVIESNYKMVDGVNIAHKTKVLINKQVVVATIKNITINPPLDEDVFEPLKHPLISEGK